jgi:hypothetical protein
MHELLALAMRRQPGVSYPAAWLTHHNLMQVMADRENSYVLEGKFQVDDANLGGERTGGKMGRGSESKVPFVAAVSLTKDDNQLRVSLTPIAGFTSEAVSAWAKKQSRRDVLCSPMPLPALVPSLQPVAPNIPRLWPCASQGTCPSSNGSTPSWTISRPASRVATMRSTFKKEAARYLAARRFNLLTLHQRLLIIAVTAKLRQQRLIRLADVY